MDDFQCPENSARKPDDMCYSSFDNCECDAGFYKNDDTESCEPTQDGSSCPANKKLDGSGDCVLDTCNHNFQGPRHSVRKANRDCYINFDDCECESGYIHRPHNGEDYCVADDCPATANFDCPDHSTRILGQQCYDTFGDCKCDDGYYKSGNSCILPGSDCPSAQPKLDASGDCVVATCHANFQCPSNSARIPGRNCYDSFDGCECASGFAKNGEVCEDATSICPSDQHLDGSGDCVMDWCSANFQCPAHSSRKSSRQCYNNFEDCQCDAGYSKEGDVCVPDCPADRPKLDGSEYCVLETCNHNYQCPIRGVRKPNRQCYNNFDDCDCAAGYKKQTHNGDDHCIADSCTADYTCLANSHRKPGQNCYDTFGDCLCDSGFQKSGEQCVATR